MKGRRCIAFYGPGEEMLMYCMLDGTFEGELEDTIEQLAHICGLEPSEITFAEIGGVGR